MGGLEPRSDFYGYANARPRLPVLDDYCDRFKGVNDSLGHLVGDELLVEIAHRLRDRLGDRDLLARLGGDEFAILLNEIYDLESVTDIADRSFSVSVNLSARQFAQPDLVTSIDEILAESGLNPNCLRLEMTESAIVGYPDSARMLLEQLRDRNIGLSIDDFGTGYSSLSYFHAFPVDTIKIDKSFVSLLDGTPKNLGLIPAILGISKTLNMVAVAEGIETPEQLAQLRELQCDSGQGYFFAQPMPPGDIAELLASDPKW